MVCICMSHETIMLSRNSTETTPMHAISLDKIRKLHSTSRIYGREGNTLLELPDDLLSYLLGLLKGRPVTPPDASPSQWSRFLAPLGPNLLLPTLFWRINALPRSFHPPDEVFHRLRHAFLQCRARALRMQQQLTELSMAFGEKGIDFLVWKGPALAATVYPDPALRPSGDIDILIRPDGFGHARSALEALGYRSGERWFEAFAEDGFEEHFLPRHRRIGDVPIDLHWKIHPYAGARAAFDEALLFQGAVQFRLGPGNFKTLCPVHALIVAAVHMILRHPHECRLSWLEDIARLANRIPTPGEWRELQTLSVAWSARLALERAFHMASLWTGLTLPAAFRDMTTWPQPTPEEAAVFPHALLSRKRRWSLFRLYWPKSGAPARKLAFLFRLLVPKPAYVRWKYPPASPLLLPLSYIKCWLGWVGLDHRGR